MSVVTGMMSCTTCCDTRQSAVPNWTSGNANFRLDKVKLHEISLNHRNGEEIVKSRERNKTAADILEPVCFIINVHRPINECYKYNINISSVFDFLYRR